MGMRQIRITKSITNRDSQSFEKYLQEIGRIELVTPDEEAELARRIRGGDNEAIHTLTKANLRFVVSVAKQYQFQGLALPDLINEGNLGLIKAAQRFDETKGFKFISYAVWWIRQTMIQAISEQASVVRVPCNKLGLNNRIQKASNLLEQQLERTPSAEELAEVLEVNVTEVRFVSEFNLRHKSLDAPMTDGNEGTFIDMLEDSNPNQTDSGLVHTDSLQLEITRCLQTLPERQREVLCLFFGLGGRPPLSLHEIGVKYDLTKERVRQLKDKAIMQLRLPNRSKLLKSFLGV
jgi:RNA polymerase primary sigma factor